MRTNDFPKPDTNISNHNNIPDFVSRNLICKVRNKFKQKERIF